MQPADTFILDHRNVINTLSGQISGQGRCYMSGAGLKHGRRDLISTIIVELDDALKEAGASDEQARCGPGAGHYHSRLSKIEENPPVLK